MNEWRLLEFHLHPGVLYVPISLRVPTYSGQVSVCLAARHVAGADPPALLFLSDLHTRVTLALLHRNAGFEAG